MYTERENQCSRQMSNLTDNSVGLNSNQNLKVFRGRIGRKRKGFRDKSILSCTISLKKSLSIFAICSRRNSALNTFLSLLYLSTLILSVSASILGSLDYERKISEERHHYLASDHEGEFCTESNPYLHRVEKRSYLPPVQCKPEHISQAIQAKVHCTPRDRVVRLPFPNDTSINQMTPSHIEVRRCDGSCHHRKQSCLAVRTRKKRVPVLLAKCTIHSGRCEKICAQVEVEEHLECGCECKIKRHHCNNRQTYSKEHCGCQCRDLTEVRACHESGRVWDPSKCMCRCPLSTLQQCSSKFVFDFTNSCKCIPEETNTIPGAERTRKDTGEESSRKADKLPHWQTLALVGTSLGIVLLVSLAVSLCRHNQRLKIRLRNSAEVLVPSNARMLPVPTNDH